MAFAQATNKSKNSVVLSLTSKSTGKTAFWLNMTDTMARDVFRKEIKDITAEDIDQKEIGRLIAEGYFQLNITDTTVTLDPISPEEF